MILFLLCIYFHGVCRHECLYNALVLEDQGIEAKIYVGPSFRKIPEIVSVTDRKYKVVWTKLYTGRTHCQCVGTGIGWVKRFGNRVEKSAQDDWFEPDIKNPLTWREFVERNWGK